MSYHAMILVFFCEIQAIIALGFLVLVLFIADEFFEMR